MSDVGGDEFLALLAGAVVGFLCWKSWYGGLVTVSRLHSGPSLRVPLYAAPLACAMFTAWLLRNLSAHDVRDSGFYILQYQLMGAGWVGLLAKGLVYFGVSARDDVVERGNAAAVPPVCGALAGFTFCYGGANIGDGPGWFVVVFSAGLSSAALAAFWSALAKLGGSSESVTTERDLAAGIRLGAWLAGTGLLLGSSVAGDWTGAAETFRDFFVSAWPALPLTAAAVLADRIFRIRPGRLRPSWAAAGVLPAIVLLGVPVYYVWTRWNGS